MTAEPVLDPARKPGTYTSDRLDAAYYGFSIDDYFAVDLLRWEINKAGRLALLYEKREWSETRRRRVDAQRLLKQLEQVEHQTSWLTQADEAEFAAELSLAFQPNSDTGLSPIPHLIRIMEDLRSLREWTGDLRKRFHI